jgi:hypothetical protein
MTSAALATWRQVGLERLAELEHAHVKLAGTGPGRRWGTTQLNRSLFLALVGQFQGFCRDLHDEAVDVYVSHASLSQQDNIRRLLTQGRKLDTGNPRRSTLGDDFGRLDMQLIGEVRAQSITAERNLEALDRVVDFRNGIAHGNEAQISQLEAAGTIKATKASYQVHCRALDRLAGTIDYVVAEQLARAFGIERPW